VDEQGAHANEVSGRVLYKNPKFLGKICLDYIPMMNSREHEDTERTVLWLIALHAGSFIAGFLAGYALWVVWE
jgi:hypothetical protein